MRISNQNHVQSAFSNDRKLLLVKKQNNISAPTNVI